MFRRTTAHAKFHNLCALLFRITSCVFEKEGLLFTLNNTPQLRYRSAAPLAGGPIKAGAEKRALLASLKGEVPP